jgi:hypothetical protein
MLARDVVVRHDDPALGRPSDGQRKDADRVHALVHAVEQAAVWTHAIGSAKEKGVGVVDSTILSLGRVVNCHD